MTIERHDRTDGAEALRVLCDNCRTRVGATILYNLHKGYGEKAKPIPQDEQNRAENIAQKHDKKYPDHSIRIMRFRAK